MAEGPEKFKNGPKRLKSLADLGQHLPSEPHDEPRPRSLSAAVADESPSTPERHDAPAEVPEHSPELASSGKEEWEDLYKQQPDGSVHGKLFWRMPDGSVYVKEPGGQGTKEKPRPLYHRIAHGGKYVSMDPEAKKSEALYWDSKEDTFTDVDPTPEIRAAAARALEDSKRREKPTAEEEEERARIEDAKTRLRERLADIGLEESRRTEIEEDIESISNQKDRRRIARRLGRILKRSTSETVAPEESSQAVEQPERGQQPAPQGEDAEHLSRFSRDWPEDLTEQRHRQKSMRKKSRAGEPIPPEPAPPPAENPAPERPPRVGPTGPRIRQAPGRPDLRDDTDRIRDEYREDHPGTAEGPPQGPPRGPLGGTVEQMAPLRPGRNALSLIHPEGATRLEAPTLDVIIADRRQRELFGEVLHTYGRQDLIEKFMGGPDRMSPPEWEAIERFRYEYAGRMNLAEQARSHLTKEDMQHMFKINPAFAPLANSVKPERALEIVREHMYHLFMRGSEAELTQYIISQRDLTAVRSSPSYRSMQARVQEITSLYRVTPDRFESPAFAQENRNLMRRMFNPGFAGFFRRGLYSPKAGRALRAIDADMIAISHILGRSVSGDANVIREVMREAATSKKRAGLEVGATEPENYAAAHREHRTIENQLSDVDALRARIRTPEFKTAVERESGRAWAAMSPADRESGSFEQLGRENRIPQRKEGRGWFASWLAALFESLLTPTRNQLASEFR